MVKSRRIDKVRIKIIMGNPSKYFTPEQMRTWEILKIVAPLLVIMRLALERDKI